MIALSAGEDGDGQAQADGRGREPLPLAQVEDVALGQVGVGEGEREGREVGILLHPDLPGEHLGLLRQLAELRVAVQGGALALGDVAEHLAGIFFQGAGNVDVPVQVHAHHGLELPQGQLHGVLRVVQVRDGGGHIGLRAGQVQFGRLRRVVAHLGEAEVLHRVLIDGIVDVVRLLREEDAIESLLHGRDRPEAGLACLLHGQFHLVAGETEALPELEVHHRHLRAEAEGDRVGTAHFHRLGGTAAILARIRVHVRDERDAGAGVELVDVIHDGVHQGGHHAGHAAARGAFPVPFLLVGAEVDFLFLEGVTVHAGGAHLREQGGVGTLAGILLPLDLHVRDLHGRILAQGDLQGVLQRKDDLPRL